MFAVKGKISGTQALFARIDKASLRPKSNSVHAKSKLPKEE